MASSELNTPNLKYESKTGTKKPQYYLVLDFEATCEKNVKIEHQEIIEFPVILVNGDTQEIEDIFHTYVKPTFNPLLSSFCTELTGITQAMISDQPTLDQVLQEFDDWMRKHDLLSGMKTFCFTTCGDWDLKTMMTSQCKSYGLPVKDYFKSWMNIKKVFKNITGISVAGMPIMLHALGLLLEGRHHSGIDDCKNITRILIELLQKSSEQCVVTSSLL